MAFKSITKEQEDQVEQLHRELLKQSEIASKTGLSVFSINGIIRRRRLPKRSTIAELNMLELFRLRKLEFLFNLALDTTAMSGNQEVESFKVDHTKLPGLSIRLHQNIEQKIFIYDIRLLKPNLYVFNSGVYHTLEHFLAVGLRKHLPNSNIISLSAYGCKTGFALISLGEINLRNIRTALVMTFKEVLAATVVPGATKEECGCYTMHSLHEAQDFCSVALRHSFLTLDENLNIINWEV